MTCNKCYQGVEGCCIASIHFHTGETYSFKDGRLVKDD